jgi:hypothetical protein
VVDAPSKLRQDVQHGSSLDLNMSGEKVEYPVKAAAESIDAAGSFL